MGRLADFGRALRPSQLCNYPDWMKKVSGTMRFIHNYKEIRTNSEFFCVSQEYFMAIMSQRDKDIEEMKERGLRMKLEKPTISSMSVSIIENVFRLFQDMYKNNGINRDDFRIALIKTNERRRRDGTSGPFEMFTTFTVNVWCLNPAIAFAVRMNNN
jgi:hypothetical protein